MRMKLPTFGLAGQTTARLCRFKLKGLEIAIVVLGGVQNQARWHAHVKLGGELRFWVGCLHDLQLCRISVVWAELDQTSGCVQGFLSQHAFDVWIATMALHAS